MRQTNTTIMGGIKMRGERRKEREEEGERGEWEREKERGGEGRERAN